MSLIQAISSLLKGGQDEEDPFRRSRKPTGPKIGARSSSARHVSTASSSGRSTPTPAISPPLSHYPSSISSASSRSTPSYQEYAAGVTSAIALDPLPLHSSVVGVANAHQQHQQGGARINSAISQSSSTASSG
ncbi:hypothetical protein HK102_011478, partial [Quaeritorhiza haematococci]